LVIGDWVENKLSQIMLSNLLTNLLTPDS
jgi:hypothetical protein